MRPVTGTLSGLVVTGGVIQLRVCALYGSHRQPVLDAHHVCPESWWRAAGKPAASPLLDLCPNCHYSVHAAIDGLIKGQDISLIAPRCRVTAACALDLAAQAGLVPALTL
jgi:hypothetical protein